MGVFVTNKHSHIVMQAINVTFSRVVMRDCDGETYTLHRSWFDEDYRAAAQDEIAFYQKVRVW